jgi:hypothetical protein
MVSHYEKRTAEKDHMVEDNKKDAFGRHEGRANSRNYPID